MTWCWRCTFIPKTKGPAFTEYIQSYTTNGISAVGIKPHPTRAVSVESLDKRVSYVILVLTFAKGRTRTHTLFCAGFHVQHKIAHRLVITVVLHYDMPFEQGDNKLTEGIPPGLEA